MTGSLDDAESTLNVARTLSDKPQQTKRFCESRHITYLVGSGDPHQNFLHQQITVSRTRGVILINTKVFAGDPSVRLVTLMCCHPRGGKYPKLFVVGRRQHRWLARWRLFC